MKKTVYYQLNFRLESPLAIGSGEGESTDKDIIVDKYGQPFIPGTSIAGVLRSCFCENDKKNLFGNVKINTKTDDREFRDEAIESAIKVYDATLRTDASNYQSAYGSFFVTQRDCVALEDKVSAEGAKFDFQAVETGAEFIGFLELTGDNDAAQTAFEGKIESALARFNTGELRLGTKTTRGYGQVSLTVKKKYFVIAEKPEKQGQETQATEQTGWLSDWLDFDMFNDAHWEKADTLTLSEDHKESHIVIRLRNRAGISIREYLTEVSTKEETMPDYIQLSLHDAEKTPVIPGSSWAGAFRERFTSFTDIEARRNLFGYVDQKKKDDDTPIARKSKITFSESRLTGGQWKKLTRNSLDRFSSATKDGNLYTEQTYYGGQTELEITVDSELLKEYISPLSCVLKDLHFGYLAVGGLTAVGRGLFEIQKITMDGIDVTGKITSPDIVLTEKDIVSAKGGEEHHAE